MFHPLPVFVGLRYVRTRRQGFFVSFISWISMAGVCLGVAALITIISVMNGFEGELRNRLVSLTAHATVSGPPARLERWPEVVGELQKVPGVEGVAPFIDVQAMLGRGGTLQPVLLHGIDPVAEANVSAIEKNLLQGSLGDLEPGSRRIAIGRVLAWQIGAEIGDELTVLVPGRAMLAAGGRPQLQTFTVTGIFEVGLQDIDASFALVALADAADLTGTGAAIPAGLRVRFKDVMQAPARAGDLRRAAGEGLQVKDWSQEHSAYFRAIRIEKTMMSLILLLVVEVAAFNIVAALVMVVNEKRSDIAILRTLGMTRTRSPNSPRISRRWRGAGPRRRAIERRNRARPRSPPILRANASRRADADRDPPTGATHPRNRASARHCSPPRRTRPAPPTVGLATAAGE